MGDETLPVVLQLERNILPRVGSKYEPTDVPIEPNFSEAGLQVVQVLTPLTIALSS